MKSRSKISSRLLPGILIGILAATLAAKEPLADCGVYLGKLQEELFLHQRDVVTRLQARLRGAAAAPAATINQDIGDIAVLGDGDGVISRRNLFNLSNRTLTLTPAAGGYQVLVGNDSFDVAASTAGTRLDGLTDDDTRQIALPFSFPFQGQVYQQLWVNSNGTLTFTEGDTDYTGSYGHFLTGPPVIAAAFIDLDPARSADGVRVLSEAGRLVVTWANMPLAGSVGVSGIQNIQLRLYPSGRIEMSYQTTVLPSAVVGVTAGRAQPVTLVHFTSNPEGTFPAVAESFVSSDDVDMVSTALKFYQTHEDAYDYLVVYNAAGVNAGAGIVAYEMTTRSSGQGYGDIPTEIGKSFGSKRRLQAVLNMGPLTQYPLGSNSPVPSRGTTGDTPLTILGHEAGHLFLALVRVPEPSNPNSYPMLGRGLAHWAFTYNSEASLLEGNRIQDQGPNSLIRFRTTGTVEGYSAMDQYLMGLRTPEEVPPSFAVLNASTIRERAPQTGVAFSGTRMEISVDDVIRAEGRRTPDSTVAQRRFRFAFIVIVPEGSSLEGQSSVLAAIQQADQYRADFEPFFANATENRAVADTRLRKNTDLSLWPAAGVVLGRSGTASIRLDSPAAAPVTFTLGTTRGVLSVPGSVTVPAGAKEVSFATFGTNLGVEELTVTPSDPAYATVQARVQVSAPGTQTLEVVSGGKQVAGDGALPQPVVVRLVDQNKLPYSGVRVTASASAGGSVEPSFAITGDSGLATFTWTPGPSTRILTLSEEGGASTQVHVAGPPRASANGVVNAASYSSAIAPGSFVSIFGDALAAGAYASASAPFPNLLSGVRVLVNGSPAPMVLASDGQINFLLPANTPVGAADILVQTSAGNSATLRVPVVPYAPGIFFDTASGYGAVLLANTASVTQVRPALPGEYLEVYCTGLSGLSDPVTATIAGLDASVSYAGLSPIPGLYQVNVQVPASAPAGRQPLVLRIGGVESNSVSVQLAAP